MPDRSHIMRMLAHLEKEEKIRQLTPPVRDDEDSNAYARRIMGRPGTEIAPGVWSDPLSESRHDYDGSQAGYEAEIAKAYNVAQSAVGSPQTNGAVADTMWDAALEIAAHIVEIEEPAGSTYNRHLARKIRALKKQR